MQDKVDILLATYNGAPFVAQQLDSLLDQSHQNLRVIIRDDASTDSTPQILQEYATRFPSKIHILPSDNQLGVINNFSHLMKHATADYIMFCDQDDLWKSDKISQTLEKMQEMETAFSKKSPLLVHTDLTVVDKNLNPIATSFWKHSHINPKKRMTLNRLLIQNAVTGCTMMMNRPLLELAWPIPQDSVMHDWWIAIVASAFGQIDIVNNSTILYRQHGANTVGAKKFWSIAYFRSVVKKLRQNDFKKTKQAQEILERYSSLLQTDQLKLIRRYLKCYNASFFKRLYIITLCIFFRKK